MVAQKSQKHNSSIQVNGETQNAEVFPINSVLSSSDSHSFQTDYSVTDDDCENKPNEDELSDSAVLSYDALGAFGGIESMADQQANSRLVTLYEAWRRDQMAELASDTAAHPGLAATLAHLNPYVAAAGRKLSFSWRSSQLIFGMGIFLTLVLINPFLATLGGFILANLLHLFNIVGNSLLFYIGYRHQQHVSYQPDARTMKELADMLAARHDLAPQLAEALVGEQKALQQFLDDISDQMPFYSVIVPLYLEKDILPNLVANLNAMLYPRERMEIILVLEADDRETEAAFSQMKLLLGSEWLKVIVPTCMPRTKAKACNYALKHAKGDLIAIFDAEDQPDPYQLLFAAEHFHLAEVNRRNIHCLQARLNYYNYNENYLTRMFAIEYAVHFDCIMQGANNGGFPLFLGGSSNHIKRDKLDLLQGWDIYNVTEDAELGWRIAQKHFIENHVEGARTGENKAPLHSGSAMLDSYTLEEAPIKLGAWMRQRSRWLKGHLQTYLALWQAPRELRMGWQNMLYAALMLFTPIMSMLIAILLPFMWFILDHWLLYMDGAHQTSTIGASLLCEQHVSALLYWGKKLFIAAKAIALLNISLFVGLKLLQAYLISARRYRLGIWDKMHYFWAFPFYFALHVGASFIALYELVARPFYWHKTQHRVSRYFSANSRRDFSEDEEPNNS